jgi:argininosuccinate lyase
MSAPPTSNSNPPRLTEPPAPELIATAYAREVSEASLLYTGMNLADIAYTVMLMEQGIVPTAAGAELLHALLDIHPHPPLDLSFDPAQGDLYSNREAYLRMLGAPVGWLSAGRARRESTTTGYRLAVRARLLALSAALAECAASALNLAEQHRATLFPDYTYLQPAQPTAFGHYLLTFVYPMLRDLERARQAFTRTNLSPMGIGSVNGSRLPLHRQRLAQLLGFDGLIPHTRDAMWQADGPIELAALITTSLITLDRLAEDLQIFSTSEFGLITLADRHTRISIIMPQKKNPYSLAYLRGLCGEMIGLLAAMAAMGKTPSGQIDNRIFAYGDIPRALDSATQAARLMSALLGGLTVNTARAAERTAQDFMGATDLAEVIMLRAGLDYKAAHDVVARAVRLAIESGATTLTADLLKAAGLTAPAITPELIAEALDPANIVQTRIGLGGASESSVTAMIGECRAALTEYAQWREATEMRLQLAEVQLLMTATALKAGHAPQPPAPESPPTEEPKPQSWEEAFYAEFKDLPQPPKHRRWPIADSG